MRRRPAGRATTTLTSDKKFMPSRVLFLGICAASRDLLLEWSKQGVLPNYESAMKRGLTGFVESMPGLYVGATWPSFASSVSPARHGRHYIEQLEPGTYQIVRNPKGEGIRREPFWSALSRAGRKMAIFDVPHSKVAADINGIQVVEWGAHDGDYGRMVSSSPELHLEIESVVGPNPAPRSCDGRKNPQEFADFRDRLVASATLRADLTSHFLERADWDFFAQVWTESHCAGHQCWHLHDRSHPRYDTAMAGSVGDPIRDVYVAIDEAIGRVLANVDPATTVIMFTGHGMGAKYDAQFFLEEMLLRLGYAHPPNAQVVRKTEASISKHRHMDDLLGFGWRCMPPVLRRMAQPVRASVRRLMEETRPTRLSVIDFASSECFAVKNNSAHGGIRVNLAGREPGGKVQPGSEYDAFCQRLVSDIEEIINLDTGEPVADRVFRTDSVYSGEYLNYLPDILIEWNQRSPVFSVGSDRIGRLDGVDPYTRTGDHRKGGIFVAIGPNIRPGLLDHAVDVTDFGPTIARLLGVPLQGVDGEPIEEIVSMPAGIL